jgi:hypothetical protein
MVNYLEEQGCVVNMKGRWTVAEEDLPTCQENSMALKESPNFKQNSKKHIINDVIPEPHVIQSKYYKNY